MQRFPDLELHVRNLCFPGDEPQFRLRSMNFGEPDVHLKHSKADVILCFFGFNESFAGDKGLDGFASDVTKASSTCRSRITAVARQATHRAGVTDRFREHRRCQLARWQRAQCPTQEVHRGTQESAEATGVHFCQRLRCNQKTVREQRRALDAQRRALE